MERGPLQAAHACIDLCKSCIFCFMCTDLIGGPQMLIARVQRKYGQPSKRTAFGAVADPE